MRGKTDWKPFGISRCATAGLPARVALEVVGAVLRDAGIELPEMLLSFHALDGGSLAVPHRRDVEKRIGLPAHLLGLVRLEQIELWRAQHRLARMVTPGLRDHAAFERHLRRVHVVGVVGIVLRMAEHEGRLNLADDVDQPVLVGAVEMQGIIAEVEADQIVDTQRGGGGLGLGPARVLDPVESHSGLFSTASRSRPARQRNRQTTVTSTPCSA